MKKYFFSYLKTHGRYFWYGVFFLTITNLLDVIPPLIIMKGIDQVIGGAPLSDLGQTALLFGTVTLILAIVRYYWRIHFGRFHQNIARHLRERLFEKLTLLGPTFYSRNPIGELMSLMSNDIEAVRMGLGPGLIVLIDALLYFLTIPPIMLSLSVPLTFTTMVLLPLLPFFIRWLTKVIHHRFLAVQDEFSLLSGITQENLTGIRVVKSYVQEDNQLNIFNSASRRWQGAQLKVAWAESFMHPVMEFCVSSGVVILLFFGTHNVIQGTLTIGAFVAFQRYISKMVWPMTAIGWGSSLISQGQASVDRLEQFFKTPPDVLYNPVNAGNSSLSLPMLNGPLELRDLSFTYPNTTKQVLRNINLTIQPGETLGITGPIGSGKTTLVQLLCHLFQINRNQIFFNEHDINDISLEILRTHISIVPQDTFLFSASIGQNLGFGVAQQPSMEALKHVAQVAHIDEEIENFPQGYNTALGEKGVNLSGGQKQRMTIGRALMRNTPFVIFDDSLSAVDATTENQILRSLREETKSVTVILISHRLTSLSLCDRVVVMKDGTIESIGTPRFLRDQSPTFRKILELQGYS